MDPHGIMGYPVPMSRGANAIVTHIALFGIVAFFAFIVLVVALQKLLAKVSVELDDSMREPGQALTGRVRVRSSSNRRLSRVVVALVCAERKHRLHREEIEIARDVQLREGEPWEMGFTLQVPEKVENPLATWMNEQAGETADMVRGLVGSLPVAGSGFGNAYPGMEARRPTEISGTTVEDGRRRRVRWCVEARAEIWGIPVEGHAPLRIVPPPA